MGLGPKTSQRAGTSTAGRRYSSLLSPGQIPAPRVGLGSGRLGAGRGPSDAGPAAFPEPFPESRSRAFAPALDTHSPSLVPEIPAPVRAHRAAGAPVGPLILGLRSSPPPPPPLSASFSLRHQPLARGRRPRPGVLGLRCRPPLPSCPVPAPCVPSSVALVNHLMPWSLSFHIRTRIKRVCLSMPGPCCSDDCTSFFLKISVAIRDLLWSHIKFSMILVL